MIFIKPDSVTNTDWEILKKMYPNNISEICKKIENNYPVQYLIGNVDFFDCSVKVNENVLIPRFETEYLVEKVLMKVKKYKDNNLKMLDICTGSGCIAIAISKNTKFDCTGIDISNKALDIAIENSIINKTAVKFKILDILNEEIEDDFDIIVSNPPYVSSENEIAPSVKYEPSIALYANNNGLLFYEKILEKIKNMPKLIAFEIGETQGNFVYNLAIKKFPNAHVTVEQDLCGKDRYIFIENLT